MLFLILISDNAQNCRRCTCCQKLCTLPTLLVIELKCMQLLRYYVHEAFGLNLKYILCTLCYQRILECKHAKIHCYS
jgi:hypothetical protein